MVKTKKKKQQKSDHMILILAILLVVVFGLCFGGLVLWHNLKPEEKPANGTTATEKVEDTISEEKQDEETTTPEDKTTTEGDDLKEQAAKKESERQAVAVDKNGLKVAAINLDVDYEGGIATAHGTITNLVEEGGTCTYVFKGPNNKEINNTTDSIVDRSSTQCKSVEMTKAELGVGTWQVKLVYKSKNAEGESESKTFSVQ